MTPAPPPRRELPLLAALVRSADGGPAEQATAVSARCDEEALHVRWECADRDAWGTLTRRDDALYEEEVVELFLAPGEEDPRRYVEIEVAPTGALFDAVIDNPEGRRAGIAAATAWDCPGLVWEVGRGERAEDWWAALAVPWRSVLAALGRPADPLPRVWRANFYRIERPRGGTAEYTAWSPTLVTPPDFHRPARFGTLLLRP